MTAELKRDPALEWLDHVQPFGIVVAPAVLKDLGLVPVPQTAADCGAVEDLLGKDSSKPCLRDSWLFMEQILGWQAQYVAGRPGGPELPGELSVHLPEHDTTLSPDWAVADPGAPGKFQLLVRIEVPGVDLGARATLKGWEATPQQRFERLLRDTGVHAGLLISEPAKRIGDDAVYEPEIRLIYAPKGETSGYVKFPLRPLMTVAGRPMLAGLKLLLDQFRLFGDADDRRLPALLKKSREAQASVSAELAGQVLGALHELLRGLDAADSVLIRELAASRPGHLYEGLLAVLMRLVFILYAEDRDLLPSRSDERAREIYESGYALRSLYARLTEDAALNPDTMDERRGAWGRLLALFRLIHRGHRTHFIQARGGKLFDPDEYPFLEGRRNRDEAPRVLPVSDGCVLRILEGLMTLKAKGGMRERLSYRALDVEQIGSVYETVMGFAVETSAGRSIAIKAGKHNRTPVFADLEKLLAAKGKERIKFLKEEAERADVKASIAKAVEDAASVEELAAALDAIVDERGSPGKSMTLLGAPILQPTDERRRTGSHYTPRSLTEPIVRHALEPAFERLGDEATPEQILDLKICDLAMGSGAFLVEACRQLGDRLVQAWDKHRGKKPPIPADEDEQLHARRLVAQHCLYGVDKNPRAVDLAKLSLWLATLARDHEFTFLDHALKCGDSLVGLTKAQISAVHWDSSKPPTFVGQIVGQHLREAEQKRAAIREAAEDATEAELRPLLRDAESKTEVARIIGNGVIGGFFSADKLKKRAERLVEFQKEVQSNLGSTRWTEAVAPFLASLRSGPHQLTPFHWEIEFPEVFSRDNPGFDAIVGNPPFAGKNSITTANREEYVPWLQELHRGAHGNSDLVAHFLRRASGLLRGSGVFGLIATNTIAQGDTRATGLTAILASGASIIRAIRRLPWPGEAAVIVSVIHIVRGTSSSGILDGREVDRINSYLVQGSLDREPSTLSVNKRKSFQGTNPVGSGFLFDNARASRGETSDLTTMNRILTADPSLACFVRPYTSGEDVANDPRQMHSRYVIDFGDLSAEQAKQLGRALFEIVERTVKPVRDKDKRDHRRLNWWKHGEAQKGLYASAQGLQFILIAPQTCPHLELARRPNEGTFASTAIVFTLDSVQMFTTLQSRTHELWARFLRHP